jgi:general stress protein 26
MATLSENRPKDLTPDEARARTESILQAHWAVLVLSSGRKGVCRGRPMARGPTDADGTMHFLTRVDSMVIAEIEPNPEVSLAIEQDEEYAVIRGTAHVAQDRALIDRLWDPSWNAWFPRGRHDPAIAIVVFTPLEGRYWSSSRTRGVSFYYRERPAQRTTARAA